MRTVVLVPRRPDGGQRDRAWVWIREQWDGWNVYEGHHSEGPFNRSAAINQASRSAGEWDVAVVADADSIIGDTQLLRALGRAEKDGLCIAHDRFVYVGEALTAQILDGWHGTWTGDFEMADTVSSMVVVRRDIWDQAHGFDEGFEGWGCEDIAAFHAFSTFAGGHARVPGPCFHLWHEPSTERHQIDANVERADRYHAAAGDRTAMRALIDELRADDPGASRPHRPGDDKP